METVLKYDENNRYHRFLKTLMIVILSLILFVELWWIFSLLADTNVLPTPIETWDALIQFINNGYARA